jgi:hypothetical protein
MEDRGGKHPVSPGFERFSQVSEIARAAGRDDRDADGGGGGANQVEVVAGPSAPAISSSDAQSTATTPPPSRRSLRSDPGSIPTSSKSSVFGPRWSS